jgi:NAD(P)-dependent dehydrogenase (short-subunit alcohol dehydrogenase family)
MRIREAVKAAGVVLAAAIVARRIVMQMQAHALKGQCVFITGGSRGLGLAIAMECAKRGANVALCARDIQALDRATERLRAYGTEVFPVTCDVRDVDQITSAIGRAYERFGRLDMLVNNAGTIAVGPLESMTRDDYQDAMDTHFWALYYAVEAALPMFKHQGRGRIVNITSIGGKVSVPHLLPYSVSKFAAVGYSEGLRAELAPMNISVTTVCPGLMRTGSPRNAWFKAQHRKEYTWFMLSDALPGFSISARSAARAIVDAALRGNAEIVLSLPAQSIALLHGVAPGLTANLMKLGALMLPGAGGIQKEKARGAQSTSALTESPLTILGKKAERQYNQIG